MSNLITITTKFYDKSGSRIINLNVQSRYAGSSKANTQKTDPRGLFVFQASPNRTVEILAKPPNQKEYTVFKTINSSVSSSEVNPIKVHLPKTIDEYRQIKQPTSTKGIVSTFFKVVDSNGKVMENFPIQSRPKGKGNSPDKLTDDQGIVEVKSSPNRDIEVLVLASNDQFVLKSSINSGNGNSQPIPIKLDEPYAKFLSRSDIKILDRDGKDYVVEKTNIEMLVVESGKKQLYSISNGRLPLQSMVGQKLEFTVYKPDGKPLKPQSYMATRIKNKPAELRLDVDVTKGTTAPNDPEINKNIQGKDCPPECVVEIVSFNSTPGPYVISMEMWKKILEFERYEARPYHPGDDSSGVTIAIGYDLGQQSKSQIQQDLASFYTVEQIERLITAQGKKGAEAQRFINKLSDITITKSNALQLATLLKTRYANQVLSIYPETLNLHPHCQGVLLSLVFNRGPGLADPKPPKKGLTRIHMRKIRDALKNNKPEEIPEILRDMSKLWNKTGPKGNSGVGIRRREEAKIFEKGLKCDCYK
ncbi:pesticin C-terminus-like muramidase [Acinetobacter ursingii]|uniref:Pesticin C-terminus-like muramidase n=2 Tax=Acinetobacter TaxID=469 RepID=A0AA46S469_9GAMM|nr:pesticin C-terminus-like muramidase [Acinetobacter ursingii]UYF71921.1 pesticin C-terminus-like muramidase [Acinetobacter ursingii]